VDQLVAERYQLLDRIGSGGAAVVYRARDTRLDRTVAVKLLRDDHAADRDFLTRFEREARIAAGLNHPNIVPVYDYGPHGATAFIAMQYVEGGNLKDALRVGGPFEPRAAIEIAEQVLSALAAAHARGLVHRDVKPQNVLVTGERRAMLTDFGIAQASAAGELTQVGTTIGSAAYMAPEQALGRPVGPPADIYGVGLLLYELLTGQPPFGTGTPVEVAFRQVNEVPRPPGELRPAIPPALESIVMKALEKDPAARFESAPAMLAALESVPLVAAGDETARMQTVRMPRVEPTYNARARAPPTAPVSVVEEERPRRSTTALILTLGILGLLVACGLLGALAAQRTGLLGAVAPPPPPTRAPGQSPPVPGGVTLVPAAQPSPTAVPPTATALPPTATGVPPTATAPPTSTAPPSPTAPPTATAVPPTATPNLRPVATPTAAVPTPTLPPPKPVPTTPPPPPPSPTAPPQTGEVRLEDTAFQGGFRGQGDSVYRGRTATLVYGSRTPYSRMTARFDLPASPREAQVWIVGLDSEGGTRTRIAIVVNDREIFRGPAPFPDDRPRQPEAPWTERPFAVPEGVMHPGQNTLAIQNLEPSDRVGQPPFLAVDQAVVRYLV
jgi:serine/threonine-protein kinase